MPEDTLNVENWKWLFEIKESASQVIYLQCKQGSD